MTFLEKVNGADLFGAISILILHLYFVRLWYTGKREEGVGIPKALFIGAFWFIAVWVEIHKLEQPHPRKQT